MSGQSFVRGDQDPWSDSFVDSVAEVAAPGDRDDWTSVSSLALEQARHAICITDASIDLPGPTIEFVNQAFLDIFGCEQADVVGGTPRHSQGELTNRSVLDHLREHLQAGTSVQAQAINYRADGSTFRLRWTIDALRRNGRVEKFFAVLHDITLEDRMRRRLAALDVLMHAGPGILAEPGSKSRSALAHALCDALTPMVAEIGGLAVMVGASEAKVPPPAHFDVSALIETSFPIEGLGSIQVCLHPEAADLFDLVGVEELVRHGSWLANL